MAPSGITGKYTVCCGPFNVNMVRIRYRDGNMTRPNNKFLPHHRPLWKDLAFFSLKCALWMSWYVGYPSTLVRKGIGKKDLMSIAFEMVLGTHFLWWILLVILSFWGRGYANLGLNTFLLVELGSDGCEWNLKSLMLRGRNCDSWARKLNPLMYIEMGMTEGVFNINTW